MEQAKASLGASLEELGEETMTKTVTKARGLAPGSARKRRRHGQGDRGRSKKKDKKEKSKSKKKDRKSKKKDKKSKKRDKKSKAAEGGGLDPVRVKDLLIKYIDSEMKHQDAKRKLENKEDYKEMKKKAFKRLLTDYNYSNSKCTVKFTKLAEFLTDTRKQKVTSMIGKYIQKHAGSEV